MLINRKAVRQACKDRGKQVTKEFLARLDTKVLDLIDRAITNARQFKRLTATELL
jgi:hypothetical protein